MISDPSLTKMTRSGRFLPYTFSSSNFALPITIDDEQSSGADGFLPGCSSFYGQEIEFEVNEEKHPDSNGETGREHQVLLYLIRHGEAEHNIEEKKAMENARRIAVEEEGMSEDDPRVQQRMEEARKSVLNDEMLRDACLSSKGKEEARRARDKLRKLFDANNGLEKPDYVLVSPLTRTLETCDIIFPDNENIHVREEISERRTGKPPDTRSSVHRLSMRPSFQRFSMTQLRDAVLVDENQKRARACRRSSSEEAQMKQIKNQPNQITRSLSQPEIFLMSGEWLPTKNSVGFSEEDKAQLRLRTENMFALLSEANSVSIACVTHKGYLRELERGAFNNPDASEFENCEIRVYRITMRDQKLVKAERVEI